ncbi:MAG: heparinase II/III family protein [candidate division Zixibacteria bacterium]|nr:heparinase II/III family protein [candidate division Zixibacteria bacterium]
MSLSLKIRFVYHHPRFAAFLLRERIMLRWLERTGADRVPGQPRMTGQLAAESRLAHWRSRSAPHFFCNRGQTPRVSGDTAELLAAADQIAAHTFDLLGSGPTNLGPDINWHQDFVSGHTWDNGFIRKFKPVSPGRSDIKVVWELSRCLHFPVLGAAFRHSGDDRYAREFVNQVNSWLDHNAPYCGPNWLSPMDAAMRLCNWIFGWYLMLEAPSVTEAFSDRFVAAIQVHGDFIQRHQDRTPLITNNHHLAVLAGLAYLGVLFPELKGAERWKRTAVEGLEREIQSQVLNDGVCFEGSLQYHRLDLEMLLYPAIICRLNGVALSPAFWDRLERMGEFLVAAISPSGLLPQIGDNDSGRLHTVTTYSQAPGRDCRYLLDILSHVYPENPLFVPFRGSTVEARYFTATLGRDAALPPAHGTSRASSKAFPDAGIYTLRSGRLHCVSDCGPVGQNGLGGHGHNDTLSFVLAVDGVDFIVDPGTGHYSRNPELRDVLRATASHNTVRIEGQEINSIPPGNLFVLPGQDYPEVLAWRTDADRDILVACHHGYERLEQPITHQRVIKLHKKAESLEIADMFLSRRNQHLEWNIPLHPEVKTTCAGNEAILHRDKLSLRVEFLWPSAHPELVAQPYSPQYGRVIDATRIRVLCDHNDLPEFRWQVNIL